MADYELEYINLGWLVPGRDSKIFLESKAGWAQSVEELPQVDGVDGDLDAGPVLLVLMFIVGEIPCFQVCPTSGVWPWPDPCSTESNDGPHNDIKDSMAE